MSNPSKGNTASNGGASLAGDLVLASGVAFFNEEFNALPHVVNALTTRASTTDTLRSDANAVDRTLAKMLDKGAEALLQSTSSLSSVSNEFEASRAKVRDLRRRVGASMASLSGRRRDLNGLSFRKAQLEHALSLLGNIELCLRTCHGPISPLLGPDADALKKAQHVFSSQVEKKVGEDIAKKISARLEERATAICKLLRGRVLDSVSAQGELDEGLIATLTYLKDLGGLDDTLTDANRHDLKRSAPVRSAQALADYIRSQPAIKCEFLSFPNMESIELIIGYSDALIEWGDLLMERSFHFVSAARAVQKSTNHLAETWEYIQDHFEKELRPLLDAFNSSSTAATTSTSTKMVGKKNGPTQSKGTDQVSATTGSERPRHYVRKRKHFSGSLKEGNVNTESDADGAGDDVEPKTRELSFKFDSSPYHLAFIANKIIGFCTRHDSGFPPGTSARGRLFRFLRMTCETSLRSVVNRDAASLFHLSLESRASEFVRAATRLETVVRELRVRVLDCVGGKGPDDEDICDAKTLLLDISHPLLHAARQRIDNAVDSQVSAWIARGGTKLVSALRADPLFLAIEARRNGDPPPNRVMLMDAAFDHLHRGLLETTANGGAGNGTEEDLATGERASNSNVAILVALHGALQRVAKSVLTKDERSEFVSVADYALFCARADVFLRTDYLMRRYLAKQISFPEMVQEMTSTFRHIRVMIEFWVESPAVLDFLFLPLAYQVCYFLSRLIVKKNEGALSSLHLFAMRSAFGAALVDASSDPIGDLTVFDAIAYALCVRRPRSDVGGHSFQGEEEARAYNRTRIYDCASWQHLFSNEEVEEL